MESSNERPILVTDTSDFYAKLIAPGAMFLVVLSIWTVIRMIWKDVDDRRILILVMSLSSLVLFLVVPSVMRATTIHKIIKAVTALLLFAPFLFGCYLVFYEGLWRLRLIEDGFSFGLLAASVIYAIGGFGVVKATYNISEFGLSVNAGKIRFE